MQSYQRQREVNLKWRATAKGLKSHRISNWVFRGVICDNFDQLYDHFLSIMNCQNCDINLSDGNQGDSRCLDHDHSTGIFRQVLCRTCNTLRC
jgi:hypothetical protein